MKLRTGKPRAVYATGLGSLYSMAGRHVESLRSHQLSLEIKRTVGDVDQYTYSSLFLHKIWTIWANSMAWRNTTEQRKFMNKLVKHKNQGNRKRH